MIRFYISGRYRKKNGIMLQCISYLYISIKPTIVSREGLYNILLEFGIHRKLVGLIKMCLNETYITVRTGKNLSAEFPIQNGLKQGDALSPLLLNFALEYAITRVQENQKGLKLNRTHQLLAYTDDNITGKNTDTIKKSREALLDASMEVVYK
jgi:hypothetical protein